MIAAMNGSEETRYTRMMELQIATKHEGCLPSSARRMRLMELLVLSSKSARFLGPKHSTCNVTARKIGKSF